MTDVSCCKALISKALTKIKIKQLLQVKN